MHMATSCLQAARRALASTDRTDKGFLKVRQARRDALRGRAAKALERIGAAEQLARELNDAPLLVQALTVHGHLLAEQREGLEVALHLYREALVLAAARKVPYAAMPARRALRQLEEQLPLEQLEEQLPHEGPLERATDDWEPVPCPRPGHPILS
jgi:hypothetical protein